VASLRSPLIAVRHEHAEQGSVRLGRVPLAAPPREAVQSRSHDTSLLHTTVRIVSADACEMLNEASNAALDGAREGR
jgi:hypothetical protein